MSTTAIFLSSALSGGFTTFMIWRALAPVKVASLPDAVITSASGGQVNASGDLLGNVTVGSEPGQHITINNNPVITGSSQ